MNYESSAERLPLLCEFFLALAVSADTCPDHGSETVKETDGSWQRASTPPPPARRREGGQGSGLPLPSRWFPGHTSTHDRLQGGDHLGQAPELLCPLCGSSHRSWVEWERSDRGPHESADPLHGKLPSAPTSSKTHRYHPREARTGVGYLGWKWSSTRQLPFVRGGNAIDTYIIPRFPDQNHHGVIGHTEGGRLVFPQRDLSFRLQEDGSCVGHRVSGFCRFW